MRKHLKTHSPWALLLWFWLRQLHNHHGLVWKAVTENKPVRRHHRAAIGLLHRVRRQITHPLAPVAAALTRPGLMPAEDGSAMQRWYEELRAAGRHGGPSLPRAFCPFGLGQPDLCFGEARQTWLALGRDPREVDQVDELAREIASLMTDPWHSSEVGWTREDLQKLHENSAGEWTKGDRRQQLLERIDSEHPAELVIDRLRAMSGFLDWAHQQFNYLRFLRQEMGAR